MDLHKEFVKLSFDIIKMKNKLISLLLEIYEKEIYKQHDCKTIYEYGFRYAKLSKEMVDKAVRTLKHLENKPFLKKVLETQGIHKVAMVATIATAETDEFYAQHVANMSKPALFEFAKEIRNGNEKCHAVASKMQIELDEEMQTLFLKFKEKYAKNLSNREALRIMLKKVVVAGEDLNHRTEASNGCAKEKIVVPGNEVEEKPVNFSSRHISKTKKREILQKYHYQCAYPGCVKPVETMHHRIPFAFERSHESVVPLCKIHHEFAHNGIIGHELREPVNWKIKAEGKRSAFDQFYIIKRNQNS